MGNIVIFSSSITIFNNGKNIPFNRSAQRQRYFRRYRRGRGRENAKLSERNILTTYSLFQILPHSRRTRVTSRTTGSSNGMTDSKRPSLSILQGFRCTYVLGKIPFTARFLVEKPLYQPGIVGNPDSLSVKSRSKIYQMIRRSIK